MSLRIKEFKANLISFKTGDTIRLFWDTIDADEVIIHPFGKNYVKGTDIFTINTQEKFFTIELEAKNFKTKEILKQKIVLQNSLTNNPVKSVKDNIKGDKKNTKYQPAEVKETKKLTKKKVVINQKRKRIEKKNTTTSKKRTKNTNYSDFSFSSLFSHKGRMSQLSYLVGTLILWILYANNMHFIETSMSELVTIFAILTDLLIIYLFVIWSIKRFHDFNKSGKYTWLYTFLTFFLWLYLVFMPGNKHKNDYGNLPSLNYINTWEYFLKLIRFIGLFK